MAAKVAEFDVANYDVITGNVVGLGTTRDDLLTPELYQQLKDIVLRVQKGRTTLIQILSMHLSAPKANQLLMEETFGGMFLGQDTPLGKRDRILKKLKEG